MRKVGLISLLMLFILSCSNIYAKNKVMVYIFVKEEEPISNSAIEYITNLKEEYDFEISKITVWNADWNEDAKHRKLADAIAKHFNKTVLGAPIIVVGNHYFDEFNEDVAEKIKLAVEKECSNSKYEDVVDEIKKELIKDTKESNLWSYIILGTIGLGVISLIAISRKSTKK